MEKRNFFKKEITFSFSFLFLLLVPILTFLSFKVYSANGLWEIGAGWINFDQVGSTSNVNIGIGTSSPTEKLDVVGYVKGRSGICIANDCRASWPAGADNLGDHTATQALQMSNNNILNANNIYANRFYDDNNSAFYLDPASVSILNDIRPSVLYDRDNTAFYLNPAETSNLNNLNVSTLYDRDDTNFYADMAGTSVFHYLQATIFYDRNNAAWRVDPNNTSRINILQVSQVCDESGNNCKDVSSGWPVADNLGNHIATQNLRMGGNSITNVNDIYVGGRYYDNDNTNYYLDPNGTSRLGTVCIWGSCRSSWPSGADNLGNHVATQNLDMAGNDVRSVRELHANLFYDRNNAAWRVDPNNTSRINTLQVSLLCDESGNNCKDVSSGWNAGDNLGNHTATQNLRMNGNSIQGVDNIRFGGLIYDSDDTNYYLDPNGTSRLGTICIWGSCRSSWPSGGDNLGNHRASQSLDMNYNNINNVSRIDANNFRDLNDSNYNVDPNGTSNLRTVNLSGSLTSGGVTITQSTISASGAITSSGRVQGNEVRATIFRDSDNPQNYYLNPTANSNLNELYVNMIYDRSANWYRIDLDGQSRFSYIDVGTLYLRDDTDPKTGSHICFSGGGSSSGGKYIGLCASSIRFKKDLKDALDLGLKEVLQFKPYYFTWKKTGKRSYGFIAEDVAKISPYFAFKDSDGKIAGINYDQISVVIARAVQELYEQVKEYFTKTDRLEKEVQKLKEQNRMLIKRIEALESK